MSEAVFVEGLTKTYAGKTVVDHLNLSVKSGTVFGLLGANGGKKYHDRMHAGHKASGCGNGSLAGTRSKEKAPRAF